MTTLNYSLAQAMGRYFQPGDEIYITQLDHEANRGPWLSLRDRGIVVREVPLLPGGTLDYDYLSAHIHDRVRLICLGWSSNIIGTVNDIKRVRKIAHQVGAWLLIDAVHYAPHFTIDVQAEDIDFLLCSAYKFYGPHVGILYSRQGLLDRLPTDRLRTTDQYAPYSIETGTLNHAAICGVQAAIRWISTLGTGDSYRAKLSSAIDRIASHEKGLGQMLYKGLSEIKGVTVLGTSYDVHRAPTMSFVHDRYGTDYIGKALADRHIYSWSGHFYAVRAAEILGLNPIGGATRLGISAYTNENDVLRAIDALKEIVII